MRPEREEEREPAVSARSARSARTGTGCLRKCSPRVLQFAVGSEVARPVNLEDI